LADATTTVQATFDAYDWLQLIGLGGLVGALGQGVRTIVGMKKLNDAASGTTSSVGDLIEPSRLVVSLAIGFIAGALAAVSLVKDLTKINAELIFALAAAGYAGADFIEGFVNRVSGGAPGGAEATKTDPTKPAAPPADTQAAGQQTSVTDQDGAVG
jgi:hypothetical protein